MLRSLSGFWDASPVCLSFIYPLCAQLTGLNLSYAPTLDASDLTKMISRCVKLQRLWVLDCISDKGLQVVASSCKDLQELRVFPSDFYVAGFSAVTEEGLVAVSLGCPKLNSLLYFCHQITNAALITVAKNCPNFTRFRLCILEPGKPDVVTSQPLDEGFGAIVRECKGLQRLSISGLLTDKVFMYIGKYAKQLEMLSIALAGDSDKGMMHVMNGCKNLRKLEIRDSPFGDAALLGNFARLFFMLKRFPIESKGRQKKLWDVGRVATICFFCFLARCIMMCFNAFDKKADLDVLDHPILNFIYYLLRVNSCNHMVYLTKINFFFCYQL